MKHIKLFETTSAFEDAKGSLKKPWIVLTKDNGKPYYSLKTSMHGLKFTALENMTITMSRTGEFINTTFSCANSKGELLTDDLENNQQVVNSGDVVYVWRNDGILEEQTGDDKRYQFVTTGKFNLGGNIDEFLNNNGVLPPYACYDLFTGCDGVIDASALKLPAMELSEFCYGDMFEDCVNMIKAPQLPATKLARACYSSMFANCAFTVAPKLPAMELVDKCYTAMFMGCSNIVTAPELSATVLADDCYQYMFRGCTSLVNAPKLNVKNLGNYCYYGMFYGCTSLQTAPELPATTLTPRCYNNMFQGCSSLVTAPELPATELVSQCYQNMFNGCSKLNYIKAMFTTTPGTTYTSNWVKGVSTKGTFIKNKDAAWTTTGVHGVPSGWTIETA